MTDLTSFILGSNAIEGIWRPVLPEEEAGLASFLKEERLSLENVTALCQVFQPDAKLRDKEGMNVVVGNYSPPFGGERIKLQLGLLLHEMNIGTWSPWEAHVIFETQHPYTDGNGRTGRAIWLWMMNKEKSRVHLPFLQHFYYQTLESWRHDTQKAEKSARVFTTQPD